MAEFQWWLLLLGLVAGGGLVAIVSADGRRREEDLAELERRAEAAWIAERLAARDPNLNPGVVEAILRVHREYLGLPPPDRLIVAGEELTPSGERPAAEWPDVEPDHVPVEGGLDLGRDAEEDPAAS